MKERICVISAGSPFHGKNLVENINTHSSKYEAYFHEWSDKWGFALLDSAKYDILLNMGYFMTAGYLFRDKKLLYPSKSIVNMWIGTDIINAFRLYQSGNRRVVELCKRFVDVQLVDAPNFESEVEAFFGIYDAKLVPSVPPKVYEIMPFEQRNTIGVFISDTKPDWYQEQLMIEVAKRLPDYKFYFFGRNIDIKPQSDNIVHTGFLEEDAKVEYMRKCNIHLRYPIHDGVGIFLIEFAQMGRHTLSNQRLPLVRQTSNTVDEIVKEIEMHNVFTEPDKELSEHYRSMFNPEIQIKLLEEAL